ncbi:hypothetical protein [Streptomyces camelliae]|uniref:DUF3558 domain-containing protein n=1 Tax=Streptomyces camelliae TaxID=3004093 RepID=A0ABY7P3D1_9ACTN|nr:hypothetical protein [Streptomyces sp. HUAS 2-6]WBO65030.1 hypothetical protein O1G22_20430 [Streptomyces sp. HUAS 2-6]
MMVRRLSRSAAGSVAVLACGLLTACGPTTHSTASAGGGSTAPVAGTASPGAVKTLPPSRLCTVLTEDVAKRVVTDARFTAQVGPDKGAAPDVCSYAGADGRSMLSLTPASRTYDAELSAAHGLRANPAPAGMSDVRIDPVSGLGRQAFRESAHQSQEQQQITFVVWNAGARTWVLTYATAAPGSTAPTAVPDDKAVQLARSLTAKLPTGR